MVWWSLSSFVSRQFVCCLFVCLLLCCRVVIVHLLLRPSLCCSGAILRHDTVDHQWYVNVSTRRSRGKSYECAAVALPLFLSSAALNVLLIQDPLFKTTGAREVV